MAQEDVKIVISADNKTKVKFGEVENALNDLGKAGLQLGKIVGVGLVAAFGTALAIGKQSFDAFIEAEKEMTIASHALNNALESMSDEAVDKLEKSIGKTGTAFEQLTEVMGEVGKSAIKLGFDDETASVAFAKLFQVTENVTQAQSDLQLAMDLAAFSGRDLESAVDAVTMVHAGGTRILKEFGVQVEDGTTSLEALTIMQNKVGGSAREMAGTAGTQLEILFLHWENLKEVIGETIAEAITPLVEKLSAWAEDPATIEMIKNITDGLTTFATVAIPMALQGISNVVLILKEWHSWFMAVADAIGTVIFKIDEAIQALKKFSSAGGGGLGGFGAGIVQSVGTFGANLFGFTGRAGGGPVSAGQSYLVGEKGPEIFTPRTSGGISNGGGLTVNIHNPILLSDTMIEKLSAQISRVLRQDLRI